MNMGAVKTVFKGGGCNRREAATQFAYKVKFNIFNSILTDRHEVVGLKAGSGKRPLFSSKHPYRPWGSSPLFNGFRGSFPGIK
jgi:hypothetical protein